MTTAYFDAAAGQWKPANTGIAPYGKCETEKHANLVLGGIFSSADGSLRLFWIPSGKTDEFSRVPTHSGLTIDPPPKPTFEVAPANAINNWSYTRNEAEKTVTLNYYQGGNPVETEVIVYGNYLIDGKTYKTRLASYDGRNRDYTYYMFNGSRVNNCKSITKITFSNVIDTSNVTGMAYMFYYCQALRTIVWPKIDTSNVTNMQRMFFQCNALTTLDLSKFNTSNVTDMEWMFFHCDSLMSLDVSKFDTSKVMTMAGMFYNCGALTSLDVSNFDTSKVTNMQQMFGEDSQLTKLTIGARFKTTNVTEYASMFYFSRKVKIYRNGDTEDSYDRTNYTKYSNDWTGDEKFATAFINDNKS